MLKLLVALSILAPTAAFAEDLPKQIYMFCRSTARSRLLAPLAFSCAVLGMTTASAGSLDNCGTLEHPQSSPHCSVQEQQCYDYSGQVALLASIGNHFSDPRDIIATYRGPQPIVGDDLRQLVDNIIAYKNKGKSTNDIQRRIYGDCIAGTLDFLDNDGLQ